MIDVHVPGDLKKMFRQEFLNRINKILVFKSLNKNDIEEIINENLNELFTLLKDKFHISIRLSGSLTNYILERCSYEKYGARSVTRTIDKMLKEPISNYIIDFQAMGKTISGCSLEVMATEQKIEFTISE
jgi:ATP-dependent Clp protease ATP-binding subunit ClpA